MGAGGCEHIEYRLGAFLAAGLREKASARMASGVVAHRVNVRLTISAAPV